MIAWLEGVVLARDPKQGVVIVVTGGVGYELRVSLQALGRVPEPGEPLSLWVHSHTREDGTFLYGFPSEDERALFRLLIDVPKVGPRGALALLGGFALPELVSAIAGGDAKRLQKIPGIGKGLSEQVVLSLRDKVSPWLEPARSTSAAPAPATPSSARGRELRDDAVSMLTQWGWKAKQAEGAFETALAGMDPEAELTLEGILRAAMQVLTHR